MNLERYLFELQGQAEGVAPGDVILWPRTPMDAMQEQVRRMVGVPDIPGDERSRLYRIIEYLQTIDDGVKTVFDICCGDALILYYIKCIFSEWNCYGLDLAAGDIKTHRMVRKAGVRLFKATLQDLVASEPPERFDVVMMLNTYRSWFSADLREHEAGLPQAVNSWLMRFARFAILTATLEQARAWKALGCDVVDLGRGEQKSRLVVVTMKGE